MYFIGKAIIYGEQCKVGIVAGYRPHLAEKNSDELLGIEFLEVSNTVVDEYFDCIVRTSYENVDYSSLKLNEKYDIREGARSVGEIEFFDSNHEILDILTVKEDVEYRA